MRFSNRACARLAAVLTAVASHTFGFPAFAGPGHDHGPAPAAGVSPSSPRVVAESENYELVGILSDGKLTIYLDRRSDTAPVIDAGIELTVGGGTGRAEPQPDGTYAFSSPVLAQHGDHEVVAVIEQGGQSDLLVGTLKDTAPHAGADPDHRSELNAGGGSGSSKGTDASAERRSPFKSLVPASFGEFARKFEGSPLMAGLLLVIGILIGSLVRGRTGITLGVVGLIVILGTGVAWAGPGHDHGEGGAAATNGDAPQRLPDGELFLPKPTQRLLAIRTRVLSSETARRADRLIGRVIADPNRSGLVQSTIGGRIKAPASGLPTLGQRVKRGQLLAYVEPAFAPIDASDVRQTAGDLAQRIAVLDARIARQKRLVDTGVVNAASLQDLEIERDGLIARRRELTNARSEPEELLAPVDGVIAGMRAVTGQVVSSADTLFNILAPDSLWIEAIAFDESIEPHGGKAKARAADGTLFELTFVGRSRALQQQATILHFKLSGASDVLSVGSPVRVLIERGGPVSGLIVPRSAIAQAPNGQMVAFKRLEPERYLPVAVRIEDLDGARVRIAAGLQPGDQIIVEGAPLVNQIR